MQTLKTRLDSFLNIVERDLYSKEVIEDFYAITKDTLEGIEGLIAYPIFNRPNCITLEKDNYNGTPRAVVDIGTLQATFNGYTFDLLNITELQKFARSFNTYSVQ